MRRVMATTCLITLVVLVTPISSHATSSELSAAEKDGIARNLPYVSDERRRLFRKRFLNAKGPRAFALSKDGAFGGRWDTSMSMEEIRTRALKSCENKPQYKPQNPCFIYMENDRVLGVAEIEDETRNKRLFVNSFDYLPVFTIGNSSDKKRYVLLFLSPTCNYCNELYLNILTAIRNGTYDVGDKELTFVLFPRNSADYVIARSLLCAGSVKFPKAFDDYQKSIYNQFLGEVIDRDFARRTARKVAKGHGVTDETLSQCDKNEKIQPGACLDVCVWNRIG